MAFNGAPEADILQIVGIGGVRQDDWGTGGCAIHCGMFPFDSAAQAPRDC